MLGNEYLVIDPKNFETGPLYGYLTCVVAPRPIALASTLDENAVPNLAPFSFFNMFSIDPPIVIFSPVRRSKDGTLKDTLLNIEKTREVVINVVNEDIVHHQNVASSEYKTGINEFEKSGLTPIPSDIVKPFRVKESPAHLECKVIDIQSFGEQGGAGNLVIAEVVKMHINTSVLREDGLVNMEKLGLVSRSGGMFYVRSNAQSLFTVNKPLTKGIGFTALPESVRCSKILSARDLSLLAQAEEIPSKLEIEAFMQEMGTEFTEIIKDEIHKHLEIKNFVESNDLKRAVKLTFWGY